MYLEKGFLNALASSTKLQVMIKNLMEEIGTRKKNLIILFNFLSSKGTFQQYVFFIFDFFVCLKINNKKTAEP